MDDCRKSGRARAGIFDHTQPSLGGAQLVVARATAVLSQYFDVDLIHCGTKPILNELSTAFCLDLGRVRERMLALSSQTFGIPGASPFSAQLRSSTRSLSQPYNLFIYSGHGVPPSCHASHGLVYCHFPIESSPDESLKTDARWKRRNAIDRWARGTAYRCMWQTRMSGYRKILANSAFTAKWIERRWGMSAEVLYPPVELSVPIVQKRNLIVSVGRFTSSRISKNQLAQISAFRDFVAQVSESWQLCLIGSCSDSAEDLAYLGAVQRAALGLPVTILLGEDRKNICGLLGEAKLFWHTAGLAVNESQFPQGCEHFGIATAEAMCAGCVPIVIDCGGQREIVEDGINGFLCGDLQELVQKSIGLAQEDERRRVMCEQAKRRSMKFAGEKFERRLVEIVAECLGPKWIDLMRIDSQ